MQVKMSFGTKIFLFSAISMLSVVGFITVKNSFYLRNQLNLTYQNHMIDTTQLSATKIQNTLSRWDTKLGYFTQAVLQTPRDSQAIIAQSLVLSEEGIEAVQMLNAGTKPELILSYPEASPLKLATSQLDRLSQNEVTVIRHPRAKTHALLSRRIKIQSRPDPVLVVVIFKIATIRIADDNSELTTFLLDQKFRDLYSGKSYEKITKNKDFFTKAEKIVKNEIGSGYLGQIEANQNQLFVAYSKIPNFPLYLIVHHDNSAIEKAVRTLIIEMLQWTSIFVLATVFLSSLMITNLLKNMRQLYAATLQIAKGHFDHKVDVRSRDEIGELGASFNFMSAKIKDLLLAEHEKARFQQELSMAQTVQRTFFAAQAIAAPDISISGYYKPASECSGDWWGHFQVSEHQHLIFIGDATGHGVSSALITAIAYSTTNMISETIKASQKRFDDPALILRLLSELLYRTLQGKMCMSFIAMIVDTKTNEVIFSNGGHPYPLLITQNPSDQRLGKNSKQPLKPLLQKKPCTGILGILPDTEFYNETVALTPGDRLVIYSDGLTEARNDAGKMWGTHGLRKVLSKLHSAPLDEMQKEVIAQSIANNATGEQFEDDVSLVIIELNIEQKLAA